ncbi:MAG: DUF2867 domain-containing protein [Gammaproteobacteria bacterium]|nr:DUF2867 domain-containing protein [Gammaproteobacteria bacterium]
MVDTRVSQVIFPSDSLITSIYPTTNLADAFMVRLPENTTTNPELLARHMFSHQAPWVSGLMWVREIFVRFFGLQTSVSKLLKMYEEDNVRRIHYFTLHSSNDREVILGEDDKHLDFRLSILYRTPAEVEDRQPGLVVSSVVTCHNMIGRIYLFFISPFHRLVVRSGLKRAAKAGWPRA